MAAEDWSCAVEREPGDGGLTGGMGRLKVITSAEVDTGWANYTVAEQRDHPNPLRSCTDVPAPPSCPLPPALPPASTQVYVALCYCKLDYYDVSLEILGVYLSAFPDSAIAVNLKACNHFRMYNGKVGGGAGGGREGRWGGAGLQMGGGRIAGRAPWRRWGVGVKAGRGRRAKEAGG